MRKLFLLVAAIITLVACFMFWFSGSIALAITMTLVCVILDALIFNFIRSPYSLCGVFVVCFLVISIILLTLGTSFMIKNKMTPKFKSENNVTHTEQISKYEDEEIIEEEESVEMNNEEEIEEESIPEVVVKDVDEPKIITKTVEVPVEKRVEVPVEKKVTEYVEVPVVEYVEAPATTTPEPTPTATQTPSYNYTGDPTGGNYGYNYTGDPTGGNYGYGYTGDPTSSYNNSYSVKISGPKTVTQGKSYTYTVTGVSSVSERKLNLPANVTAEKVGTNKFKLYFEEGYTGSYHIEYGSSKLSIKVVA